MARSFNNLHVAIVSSPGMGHLIPVLVLANRLAAHHNVHVTVLLITAAGSSPESNLPDLPLHPELVQIIQLPPVDISHLVNPSTRVVTQLCLLSRNSLPLIRSAIAAMDRRPDALIADLFSTETPPIADEFDMSKYLFVPTTAWFTALTMYCPAVLDREIEGEYVDQPEPLRIPGCKPVRPEDVADPMVDRKDQQYHEYKKMGKNFLLFDGILLNSWEDLEPTTLQAFRDNETWKSIMKVPVYPIGPLRKPVEPVDAKSELIGWLDRQPNESVMFVSFGSGGMLSAEQTTELAWGLELSQQRFVWVVRPPTIGPADDAYFALAGSSSEDFDGTPNYLPEGFLTRTQDKGFLVTAWAPQARILDHPAVAGFMSHCGWNSTIESITCGVPIIALPLYAEQRMNATFLTEVVGVAVWPWAKQVVARREEIERLVRRLVGHEKEGEGQVISMRDKVKKLKMSAIEGLKNGGASHKSMCDMLSAIALRSARPGRTT